LLAGLTFCLFALIIRVFAPLRIHVGMEEVNPQATPVAQPFKVGYIVHVFEGACTGLVMVVVVCGCSGVSWLVISSVVWLGFVLPY
jgi:hypothetical protein